MPDLIAFQSGVSMNRFMGQMTMSTEGIYGIPLWTCRSTIVFLFVLFGAMLDRAGAGQYFIPSGLEPSGRLQRRAGQGGYYGQRIDRPGVRLQHCQYRDHRHLYHSA